MPNEKDANLDELEGLARAVSEIAAPANEVDLTARESGDVFQPPPRQSARIAMQIPSPNPASTDKRDLIQQLKNEEIGKDELVSLATGNPSGVELFDAIIRELTVEISSLTFDRRQAEKLGEDSAQISSRKVTALKALAESWLAKRKLFNDEALDLKGDRFQKVLQYLLEVFRDTMLECNLDKARIGEVLAQLAKNLDGWEDKARERALANAPATHFQTSAEAQAPRKHKVN